MLKTEAKISGKYGLALGGGSRGNIDIGRDILGHPDGFIENLITNRGLNLIANTTTYCGNIYVGSGTAEPQETDLQLQALVASASTGTGVQGINETEPYGIWWQVTVRFNPGEAEGNLSELGCGPSANSLFSRALLLDSLGNPTTITILEDEWLDVTYRLEMVIDTGDSTGTFTLTGNVGGVYDYIMRPAEVTKLKGVAASGSTEGWGFLNAPGLNSMSNRIPTGQSSQYVGSRAYTGDIGPVTDIPSGSVVGGTVQSNKPTMDAPPYVQDSHEVRFIRTSGLNIQNGLTRSMLFNVGIVSYQIQFDPPINKTNEDVLVLELAHRWGRV